jgi:hypothetical protein
MATKKRKRRGPGRPPIHDSKEIRKLLAERERTGESFAALSARSGIPAGTLSSRSRQARTARGSEGARDARRSAFVEVVVARDPANEASVSEAFEVVVETAGRLRRVLVPMGFDASELHRLVEALERRC